MNDQRCISCGKPCETWSYENRNILQIMPAGDVMGIFVSPDGTLQIEACAALALVSVVEVTRTAHVGHQNDHGCHFATEEEDTLENDVTGLSLNGGYYEIMDECYNFAGLCRPGDDPWECLGKLNWDMNKEFEKAYKERNPLKT